MNRGTESGSHLPLTLGAGTSTTTVTQSLSQPLTVLEALPPTLPVTWVLHCVNTRGIE